MGESHFLAPLKADIAFATNRLARSLAKTFKIRPHCLDTSLAISVWYAGFWSEAASAKQSAHDEDSAFTDGDWPSDRPTRKSVSSWVIMLDGFLNSAKWNTGGDCSDSSHE